MERKVKLYWWKKKTIKMIICSWENEREGGRGRRRDKKKGGRVRGKKGRKEGKDTREGKSIKAEMAGMRESNEPM